MLQRYVIVGITAVAAMWMYIDRVCFSTLTDTIQKDLGFDDEAKGFLLGAFFLSYALFQIPIGALADRFGARLVLTVSIAAWSAVTAATGFINSFAMLFAVRILLGITEAGAYPAAAGLVKRWARPEERGRFSSVVALGGRIGGASAPYLTATLAAALVGIGVVEVAFTPSPPATPPNAQEGVRANWRGVFAIYGVCGLLVAALFGLIVRNRPSHPPAPESQLPSPSGRGVGGEGRFPTEQKTLTPVPSPGGRGEIADANEWHALPEEPAAPSPAPHSFFHTLVTIAMSRNMFFFGAVQFGVNLGWAFLITLLPTYLNSAYGVPLEMRGTMQSVALFTGCCGMFFGGFATDALRRWLGPRYGRSVPIGLALGCCALAFLLAPVLPSAWAVVFALGLMAFLVDLHNPSIWSFAQDVGGRNVGAALGWGNMWGNLGAALSPPLLTLVWQTAGWNVVFLTCAMSFALAAVCGFMLNASKPLGDDRRTAYGSGRATRKLV